jgi:hypothetical protein
MTSKEEQNENLYEWISGILGHVLNGYPLQRSALNRLMGKSNGYLLLAQPICFRKNKV